ncbi:hypothetical protein M413DRAFT_59041, partial [Hebeloma cylindrosporum]
LDHIPTVGYSSPLLSYISALRFFKHGREIIAEGYRKYPNQVWKLPTWDGWFVVANGIERVEEIGKASDKYLSGVIAFASVGFLIFCHQKPYHTNVVRTSVTRNIATQFKDMHEEMILTFEEMLPPDNHWTGIPIFPAIVNIMSRISARLSVGYPLCNGRSLRYFPAFLRPLSPSVGLFCKALFTLTFLDRLAARLLNPAYSDRKVLAEYLRPLIQQRLNQERVHGPDWEGKPNDVLMWLLDEAGRAGLERTPLDMATRLYFLTFASHPLSTVRTFMCAIYEVITRPEYLQPLRDEVSAALESGGGTWSKNTISKLYKMDSFFREVQRYYDMQLRRRVLQDFSFSDGTIVPAGSTLYVNSYGLHHDETLFPSPNTFDGFRFLPQGESGKRGEEELELEERLKRQPMMSKPTLDYNAFGYGKNACPGRFSAAYQLKTMLAYIITTYDMKIEEGEDLATTWVEMDVNPNVHAKVFFKRRFRKE